MAKRSTKKPASEKPRAFLLGTMTLTLISETLAEVERLEALRAERADTSVTPPPAPSGASGDDDRSNRPADGSESGSPDSGYGHS